MKERLQKVLARAGHGSRRSSERLITAGRVTVNGQLVTELGAQVDPDTDRIELDGTLVTVPTHQIYLLMNKPEGYVTTARDPQGRKTVMHLLPRDLAHRVFPIGRLDVDTEGLLLFTNDGELAHRLAHPRYTIDKEYLALVEGSPSDRAIEQLRTGVDIDDITTSPAIAERAEVPPGRGTPPDHSWLRLVIHEGRKRQVRRMCEAVGHPVRSLVRVRLGDVVTGDVKPGQARPLSDDEVRSLRAAVGLE